LPNNFRGGVMPALISCCHVKTHEFAVACVRARPTFLGVFIHAGTMLVNHLTQQVKCTA
jgi:hypothetical protein